MKSYTDVEQSKKLAEILPIETADMYYCYGMDIHTKKWDYDIVPTIIDVSNQIDSDSDIPCWSLAALLKLIPNYQLQTQYNSIGMIYGHKGELEIVEAKCPLDTCYEMIIKLHEKNLL